MAEIVNLDMERRLRASSSWTPEEKPRSSGRDHVAEQNARIIGNLDKPKPAAKIPVKPLATITPLAEPKHPLLPAPSLPFPGKEEPPPAKPERDYLILE